MTGRLDFLSIGGFFLALAAIMIGQTLDGGALSALLNGPAFVIVIGGTLGASLLQTPPAVLRRTLAQTAWVVRPPACSLEQVIDKVLNWSAVARQEGYIGLENLAEQEHDPFAAKALHLLADGTDPAEARHILELELTSREELDFQSARVLESMGGYAPTLGILGAVLGLMQVMDNLADPEQLGAGIAAAFVATVYGVGAANLLFLPLACRLRGLVERQSRQSELLIEGVVAIAHGDHIRAVQTKLRSFARYGD